MYDIDHYITKLEAIPDEKWCTGTYTNLKGQHCVYGHLCTDAFKFEERVDFDRLVNRGSLLFTEVNDGNAAQYQQPTPKARVIAALKDLRCTQ